MKYIFGLVVMAALPTFACPNLAGSYTCKSSDGEVEKMDVMQTVVNGVTIYEITRTDDLGYEETDVLEADGQARSVEQVDPETGTRISTQIVASCSANVLNLDLKMSSEGFLFVNVSGQITKTDGKLYQKSKGVFFDQIIDEEIICE